MIICKLWFFGGNKMIKKIYLFAAILSVSLLCGCERQRMTAEYEQETIEETGNVEEENVKQSAVETHYKIESNHEFMKNTYRQVDKNMKSRIRDVVIAENRRE